MSTISPEIQNARQAFDDLKHGAGRISRNIEDIRENLELARADASALDPDGKKTAQEMEAEILKAKHTAHLIQANTELTLLSKGIGVNEVRVAAIEEQLAFAKQGLEKTDPLYLQAEALNLRITEALKHAKSIKAQNIPTDVQKPFTGTSSEKNLSKAKAEWALLIAGHGDIDFRIKRITSYLSAAAQEDSTPEVRSEANLMNKVIPEAKRSAHLAKARTALYELQHSNDDNDCWNLGNYIAQQLVLAGTNASALDPHGKRTADEMNAIIQAEMQSNKPKKQSAWTDKAKQNPDGSFRSI